MAFNNPFGVLKSDIGQRPSDIEHRTSDTEHRPSNIERSDNRGIEQSGAPAPKGPARAVVRIERAGRGGKGVTVIEHLQLGPAQLADWLKHLKAALGCGGAVEGDAIVLQGDQRPRLPELLKKRGVRKITLG